MRSIYNHPGPLNILLLQLTVKAQPFLPAVHTGPSQHEWSLKSWADRPGNLAKPGAAPPPALDDLSHVAADTPLPPASDSIDSSGGNLGNREPGEGDKWLMGNHRDNDSASCAQSDDPRSEWEPAQRPVAK